MAIALVLGVHGKHQSVLGMHGKHQSVASSHRNGDALGIGTDLAHTSVADTGHGRGVLETLPPNPNLKHSAV